MREQLNAEFNLCLPTEMHGIASMSCTTLARVCSFVANDRTFDDQLGGEPDLSQGGI